MICTNNLKSLHPSFRLNGQKFNAMSIKALASFFIKNGTDNELCLGDFIKKWIDDSENILINTSGTISVPKLLPFSKSSFVNSAKSTGTYFDLKPGDSALCCLPFSFIAGKMMFIRAWVLGLKLDIIEPSSTPLITISSKRYDFSAMVPLQLQNSISHISNIKILLVGGAPLSKSLASKIYGQKSCVYETFGMTETLTHIAVKNISSGESSFSILPNVSISQDSRGCLIVSAPDLSVHNLHTNDIVNKISDYKFLWLGRYDNVINSGGIKIQPEILEKHIEGQIKNRFFITSIPDNKINEKVILIVEGKTQKFDLKWNSINPLMRPKEIYFTKKFFENKSGKIQRKKTLYSLNLYNS